MPRINGYAKWNRCHALGVAPPTPKEEVKMETIRVMKPRTMSRLLDELSTPSPNLRTVGQRLMQAFQWASMPGYSWRETYLRCLREDADALILDEGFQKLKEWASLQDRGLLVIDPVG